MTRGPAVVTIGTCAADQVRDVVWAVAETKGLSLSGLDPSGRHDSRHRPDILVVDDLRALRPSLIEGRRAASVFPIVIAVIDPDLPRARIAAMESGADHVVGRGLLVAELSACIDSITRRLRREHLRRKHEAANERLASGDLLLDVASRVVTLDGRAVELTPTECVVLACLVRNAGRPVARSEIRREMWGFDVDTSSNAVEVYVRYLRRKLEEEGKLRVIHTVRGVGYVLRFEDGSRGRRPSEGG